MARNGQVHDLGNYRQGFVSGSAAERSGAIRASQRTAFLNPIRNANFKCNTWTVAYLGSKRIACTCPGKLERGSDQAPDAYR
jgi:hypothetical protein